MLSTCSSAPPLHSCTAEDTSEKKEIKVIEFDRLHLTIKKRMDRDTQHRTIDEGWMIHVVTALFRREFLHPISPIQCIQGQSPSRRAHARCNATIPGSTIGRRDIPYITVTQHAASARKPRDSRIPTICRYNSNIEWEHASPPHPGNPCRRSHR